MKFIIYILFLCPLSILSQPANLPSQDRLELAVFSIIEAYNTKNDIALNRYINSEIGVYFILKANGKDYLLHRGQICLQKECINEYNFPVPYGQILLEQRLDTTQVIQYTISDWSQEDPKNIVIDKKEIHILTDIIRRSKLQHKLGISNIDLRDIWKLESNSIRIRVHKDSYTFGSGKFTFYLSYLNNNWYLSAIYFNY